MSSFNTHFKIPPLIYSIVYYAFTLKIRLIHFYISRVLFEDAITVNFWTLYRFTILKPADRILIITFLFLATQTLIICLTLFALGLLFLSYPIIIISDSLFMFLISIFCFFSFKFAIYYLIPNLSQSHIRFIY